MEKLKPMRTVEGMVTATDERITSIKQLKDGDVVVLGYSMWNSYKPYRLTIKDGVYHVGIISAVTKGVLLPQIWVELTEEALAEGAVILYKAEIEESDRTRPIFYGISFLLFIVSVVIGLVTKNMGVSLLGLILSLMCMILSRVQPRWNRN